MPAPDLPPAAPLPRRVLPPRAATVLGSLLFASLVCLGMIFGRRFFAGRGSDSFMAWNLVLAWIPLLFAFAAYGVHLSRTRRNLLFAVCALTWFFFFPNAPYIITDFVHLDFGSTPALLWIDLFTIASAAWTGLCLGYVSLCLMQEIVAARCGRVIGWLFVLVMLAVSSLGIYMGRFLRWNSWDALRHPIRVFQHGHYESERFVQPAMRIFLLLMFLFLVLSYGTLYALAQLHERERD